MSYTMSNLFSQRESAGMVTLTIPNERLGKGSQDISVVVLCLIKVRP